jgi:hypothetical protein
MPDPSKCIWPDRSLISPEVAYPTHYRARLDQKSYVAHRLMSDFDL